MAGPFIAEIASLLGDPGRANILTALMSGQALTATELSHAAGVSPQTTSGHLAKLVTGRLLTVVSQGRHRYYRLASSKIAEMLEVIMETAIDTAPRHRPKSIRDAELMEARTCYSHLAGRLAVNISDSLRTRGMIDLDADGGLVMPAGKVFFEEFGIALGGRATATLCRPCLDWSERRWHIGGSLGSSLLQRMMERDWLRSQSATRAMTVTDEGRKSIAKIFGVALI